MLIRIFVDTDSVIKENTFIGEKSHIKNGQCSLPGRLQGQIVEKVLCSGPLFIVQATVA